MQVDVTFVSKVKLYERVVTPPSRRMLTRYKAHHPPLYPFQCTARALTEAGAFSVDLWTDEYSAMHCSYYASICLMQLLAVTEISC